VWLRSQESEKLINPAEGSTAIGKSVVIRGDLSGNEDLYMDGEIEGTITLPESRLTVGPNARIRADVHARDVVVLGHLTGNVNASGRVDLRQSALVTGDIIAGRLSIEESVVLKGRVELKASAETQASRATAAVEASGSKTPLFNQPGA
jgi:cytoskeletal protein CcmA (bactofilin family)